MNRKAHQVDASTPPYPGARMHNGRSRFADWLAIAAIVLVVALLLGYCLRVASWGGVMWTTAVTVIAVVAAASLPACAMGLLIIAFKPRVEEQAWYQCRKCGYDLRGNTAWVCPECGELVETEQVQHDDRFVPPPGVG